MPRNKLRTVYAGKKTDGVIDRIAKTFAALCDYGDFPTPTVSVGGDKEGEAIEKKKATEEQTRPERGIPGVGGVVALDSLQYHINIVLPESRDQAVYDAIFRSLREHLGTRHG